MSAQTSTAPKPRWAVLAVLVLFGLFYAYAVWNAVAFLLAHTGDGLSTYGWFVLIFAVVFPLIVLAIVYAIGNARRILDLIVVALAGLGVVAVFWLNVLAHFAVSQPLFLQ